MQTQHDVSPRRPTRQSPTSMRCGLTQDPSSKSGRSLRVIGFSHSRRAVLTVILVHRNDADTGGANGWESNPSARRSYEEGK